MSFEDRLRDRFQRASVSMPDADIAWEPTITKARRARARRMTLMAAAAAVALGGAVWAATSLEGPAEHGLPPAGDPTEQASPETEETPDQTDESRAVRSRVLDWVKALSLGDEETAWSWMSRRTQEHFDNDIQRFRETMSAFSEGFGAWYTADPPPETTFRVLASSGDGTAGVVEIHGLVTKEGTEELGHDALPVRIVDGKVFVEPFGSDVELSAKEPSPYESYPADDLPGLFEITGIGEVQQVNFFYDGVEESGDSTLSERPGKTFEATSPAPQGIAPGPHFVTVAAVDDAGGIAVLVVPYFVE